MKTQKEIQIRDSRNGDWFWVNNAVLADPHLTPAEKLTYSAICTFSGCAEIHPTIETLAQRSNLGERIVRTAIKKLEEVGYVTLEKGVGRGNANTYHLLKATKGCKLCTFYKSGTNRPEKVQNTTIKGAQSAAQLDKEEDNKKTTVADATIFPFSFYEELKKLKNSPRLDFKVIALYWWRKGYQFSNKAQFNGALRRELRPASRLTGYSGKEISLAIDYCENEYGDKIPWTLETVGKRISDLVNKKN